MMPTACKILTIAVLFSVESSADDIDFNLDVRPILSNKCLLCHGPDPDGLQAGLRLDLRETATIELDSGLIAVVPGKPDESELMARIISDDEDIRMPPPEHGASLTAEEVDVFRRWIQQGANFATHWSYVKPSGSVIPPAQQPHANWPINSIDNFALNGMLPKGLSPSKQADRAALARRVFLDLTGLPPSIEEVDAFVASTDRNAYEKLVDELLQRSAFGEHWARKWLDLARYADSAGYADDPPRTIWAYRDWVIKAINSNMPFDQFTREQLAGDLLPNATEDQLIATAFHRNTLTNNEGGTQDEEFRNEAVVDRVNTTMAVWMGTTMACAQCHTHKYDPITQEEYFRFFALLNNTQDADRRDESPTLKLFSGAQKHKMQSLRQQIASLKKTLDTPTPELVAQQQQWEELLQQQAVWHDLIPTETRRKSGQEIRILEDGTVAVDTESLETLPTKDTYVIEVPVEAGSTLSALRLSAIPDATLPKGGSGHAGGNFVVTGFEAEWIPAMTAAPVARFVRITQHGKQQLLSLAEVEIFSNGSNVTLGGDAIQSSVDYSGAAKLAIDGNTDGDFQKKSVTHSKTEDSPWWEIDLGREIAIDRIKVWNRTDNDLQKRLSDFSVTLMDAELQEVWTNRIKKSPDPSAEVRPTNVRQIGFRSAGADYHQKGFEPEDVLTGKTGQQDGWAVGGAVNLPHHLVVALNDALTPKSAGKLRITLKQNSPHSRHLLGRLRLSSTSDYSAIERSKLSGDLLAIVDQPEADRSVQNVKKISQHFRRHVVSALSSVRKELKDVEQQLAGIKPDTSVPILRERTSDFRVTNLQFRGSYLDKGPQVVVGVPAVFHPESKPMPSDRLQLAEWLVDGDNPLTARVLANRYWETIFGRGIVATSEEFGSQGELPTHPELLDWLATEVVRLQWDRKAILKLLVMSATYRQSAFVDAEMLTKDPDNRWLSRGPRIRLSAEMVRDQALAVAGLLSSQMYGPPVNPPQPDMGLKAAFGGSTDWKTSSGEDRYRRGLYTTWRRSNPYPSMATFDAPNREVCTVRRNSTNTPLQSLVTLNDPVYVEAAQALGRIALQHEGRLGEQLSYAFKRSVLRLPTSEESAALQALFQDSKADLSDSTEEALSLATIPLGPLPDGIDAVDAAAMTVVCNVLLNLDEMFLKR